LYSHRQTGGQQEAVMNTIHRKDCIQGLQAFNPGFVDLAFADPPFNIGYEYDVYHDKQDNDGYLQWTRQWMEAVHRALKPTGTFWVAIGDEFAAEIKMIGQRDLGLTCRSWIVWYYTFGVNCTKKFNRSHVHLFHFVKDSRKFTFNQHTIRVPSARQLVYADGRASPNGKLPDDTWILRPQDVAEGFRPDQDTWYFPRVAGTFKERAGFHGCQMPEQLLGRIIRSCSNPGELVLDPFAGSGTTLAVANKLGRRWLGFEISESYAEKALARIGKTYHGQPLEGAPEPLISAPQTPLEEKQQKTLEPCQTPSRPLIRAAGSNTVPRCELDRAIIAAFLVANEGFSTDRVIADPELNASFLEQCRKFGIPGEPVVWNRDLMGMRKAAKLAGLPAARRTTFRPEELDRHAFASEIAMRRMLDAGSPSLDDVLCDPEQARRFDQIACSFAPGFSPLQYRWAALTIRKGACDFREKYRTSLAHEFRERRLPRFQPLTDLNMERIGLNPGVYVLRAEPYRLLYAGETFDLGARIRRKLEAFTPWEEISKEIQIGVIPFPGADRRQWLGFKSHLITERAPALNYLELGAA
jgi:site-specific DNA-methyltransferase (adenine-specific)